ncbi:MAG TPA: cysteine desulfurase family protein [Abditibacteriaceae bacterium]|jgi:cysteine desulfurase
MQQRTRVYFDHAATTPLLEAARSAMQPYVADGGNALCGNASSPYEAGRTARMAIDRARTQVAALIGANADEVVFTGGGTESNNWALLGVALRNLERRGHVIVSAIEHHAVLEPAETLRDLGFAVDTARVGANGVLDAAEIERLLRPEALLVSVMAVNNEVGTVQPIGEIGKLTRERGVLLHCDASQAAGKLPLDVEKLNIDLLTLSAHKFGGPKGVGALYIRRGVKMQSLLRGGGQERGRRAGTENVPGIVGMGAAAQWSRDNLDANAAHLTSLRERLENGLRVLDGAHINGEHALRAPHVTNVTLVGKRAESLALGLDLKGFAVGTGSACASGALEPSHVLAAMGHSREEARAALRISLGVRNTADEIDELVYTLKQLLQKK